jgi:3-oxoacyl-[acyl-carrier-protein] synthase-1
METKMAATPGRISMKPVYCIASNITCPIGLDTEAAWAAVQNGQSGVRYIEDELLFPRGIWASAFTPEQWAFIDEDLDWNLSPLERMSIYSARDAISLCGAIDFSRTLFVLTTTKGNIEWLGQQPDDRIRLTTSAALIASACGIDGKPTVISHACVSGVSGLIYALRCLQHGRFETAIITGADRLTPFVLSGFSSFQALADERCRPFDSKRKGINLGEAAATIILSTSENTVPQAMLCGGATSNDANHISGPSRTGEELGLAISKALGECRLDSSAIDAISAHGTATIYNDEMESKAFAHTQLLHAPLHSIKGYLGHTLGAAGVVENALLIESMRRGTTIASLGFETPGVSQPVNVSTRSEYRHIRHALKTASGFGGCNAAVVWSRP